MSDWEVSEVDYRDGSYWASLRSTDGVLEKAEFQTNAVDEFIESLTDETVWQEAINRGVPKGHPLIDLLERRHQQPSHPGGSMAMCTDPICREAVAVS